MPVALKVRPGKGDASSQGNGGAKSTKFAKESKSFVDVSAVVDRELFVSQLVKP